MNVSGLPDPLTLVVIIIFLGLAPFAAVMVTSFVKIVVVLSLIRNALGIQSIPPNLVLNGLALILSFYIMSPVAQDTFDILQKEEITKASLTELGGVVTRAKGPLQTFLLKHSKERDRQFFVHSAKSLWPKEHADQAKPEDFNILIPAFTVGELSSAFQIGFLLYLPFIAIDLIVANILMALGMMMVSPTTISLPFKLLLFVLVDGWARLIHGLVLTYA